MSDQCDGCLYNNNENPNFNCNKDLENCCYLKGRRWIILEHKKKFKKNYKIF